MVTILKLRKYQKKLIFIVFAAFAMIGCPLVFSTKDSRLCRY